MNGPRRYLSGLGLVELMISLALGAVLSLGLTVLIVNAQRHYWYDEQIAQMRDNGRYAVRLLRRELGMAGFFGHAQPGAITHVIASNDACYRYLLAPVTALEHFDDLDIDGVSSGQLSFPLACRREDYYAAGSDALLVRRVASAPARLRGESHGGVTETAAYLQGGGEHARLALGAGDAADLWRYTPRVFFVRNYSASPGDRVPGLCRLRLSPSAARLAPVECLVEGVENLQLSFALDTDGDRRADEWVTRPEPGQMERALLVRIELTMRSRLPLSAAGDYLRQGLTAIVLLRNSDVLRS